MQKVLSLVTFVALVVGGWYFATHFKIEGLDSLRVIPMDGKGPTLSRDLGPLPPVQHDDHAIRIAAFNIQAFGPTKAESPQVMRVLADIVHLFDIVAIQEIRSRDQTLIERFVEVVNLAAAGATAREYRYVLGPRVGRNGSEEQLAFIYNAASVEVDPGKIYSIDDPEDILRREPLVAQFRVRGPAAEEAFTFILINVHVDPENAAAEVDSLADVYRVVRQVSSGEHAGEDDVIILGDLNAPGRMPLELRDLGRLGQLSGIQCAVTTEPTNARRNMLYDNLVFHGPSTVEFTGRAGVLNVMRRFNLTRDEELAVSDHLPVWAEFTLFENGTATGPLAARPPIEPQR